MAYDLTGTVKTIFDLQTFASGFTKREFVVTTEDKFPQDIKLGCLKDRTGLLDAIKPGDKVKVSFNLNGREYNGKYFVDLTAWRIEPADGAGGRPAEDERLPEDSTDYSEAEDAPF
ncbi:MAG: DUF3127 domain-containing protein [Puniceicoccaceae bacterium]|nr:MAG: DUF3127 domain-containing protein [Puniceicoccaceae bacterium]